MTVFSFVAAVALSTCLFVGFTGAHGVGRGLQQATGIGAPIPNLYDASRLMFMGNGAAAPIPSCCPAQGTVQAASISSDPSSPGCTGKSTLAADSTTGSWGYFYDGLEPALVITSGMEISTSLPTYTAAYAWEELGQGDPALEEIYLWDENGPLVTMRGPVGNTGAHWLQGPFYVCGAEEGDVIQVDILELMPRPNPGYDNRTFGICLNSAIGWQNKVGYVTPTYKPSRRSSTIYELIKDEAGNGLYWEPYFAYDTASPLLNITTPSCAPTEGEIPRTTEAGAGMWINPNNTFGAANTGLNNTAGRVVPCNANSQSWTYPNNVYSGQIVEIPEELKDYSIQGKWRVPVNYHTGIMGLAPKTGAPIVSGPPTRTGGNVDDRRMGVGATMYYPVEVAGALLSMGDVHGAMGDGESGGTGIETSIEAKFRVTLHKKDSLPKPVSKLDYPLLENANEYVIHGYAYADYLREVPNPQYNITSAGLNFRRAMDVLYNQTREFVMTTFDLEEDYAINVMSNTVDFGVTQIVDANVGLHAIVPKWPFNASAWENEPYYQAKVMPGTSRPFGAP